jgi:hypothetical protein
MPPLAALGGADRMDIGRGEPLGTARKRASADQILAEVRLQNRRQSRLIRNLRRVYGYGLLATGGLAIELAVQVGGLSVPRVDGRQERNGANGCSPRAP